MQFQYDKFSTKATAAGANSNNNNNNNNNNSDKKKTRALADLKEARADVAKMHVAPQIFSTLAFVVLYRILAAEHVGHVMGLLPFVPWKFFQRITLRGIDYGPNNMTFDTAAAAGVTDPTQGCAFLLIYLLCTMSIKYYIHQAIAIAPPKGADGGMMAVLEDPKSQKILKAWGLDDETMDAKSK
jgi:hypothetical protein